MESVSTMDDGEKYITNTAKPPMVVWLDRYAGSVQCLGFYAPKKESLHVNDEGGTKTYGPYVHLDQFLEEVERRVRLKTWPHLDYDDDLTWEVLQELDKEIKEGKV